MPTPSKVFHSWEKVERELFLFDISQLFICLTRWGVCRCSWPVCVGGGFGKLKTIINHSPVFWEYKMSFLFNWLQYHFNLVCVLTITTNCNSTMTRVGRKSGLCALMTHSAVAATIPRLQITADIHDVQEVRLTLHNLFWCQCLRSFH